MAVCKPPRGGKIAVEFEEMFGDAELDSLAVYAVLKLTNQILPSGLWTCVEMDSEGRYIASNVFRCRDVVSVWGVATEDCEYIGVVVDCASKKSVAFRAYAV
jgi:hypothetical protein